MTDRTAELGPLVEVHVLAFPVALWVQAQQRTDELLREFTLIAGQLRHEPDGGAHVPVQLMRLIEDVSTTYRSFSTEQEAAMYAAADGGTQTLDLTYHVPQAVGPAARHLADMLDLADEYCRAGQHLLTLAAPPELVRFRTWFLGEFVRQAEGAPPTRWPDYRG